MTECERGGKERMATVGMTGVQLGAHASPEALMDVTSRVLERALGVASANLTGEGLMLTAPPSPTVDIPWLTPDQMARGAEGPTYIVTVNARDAAITEERLVTVLGRTERLYG